MTIFLFSALTSSLLFFSLLLTSPGSSLKTPSGKFHKFTDTARIIIQRRLRGTPEEAWVFGILISSAVILCLLFLIYCIIYYYDKSHGLFGRHIFYLLSSQDFFDGIFGFMFGIFFSYWIISVFWRGRAAAPTYKEYVALGLLIVFALLGLGRQIGISDLLARLSGMKLPGGAEVSFYNTRRDDIGTDTALAALVPPSMSTSNNSSSNSVPDTSSGLTLMAQSSGNIQRDALYAVLRGKSDLGGFVEAFNFAEKTVTPLANCLLLHVRKTGDDEEIGQMLMAPARSIRTLLKEGLAGFVTKNDIVDRILNQVAEIDNYISQNETTNGRDDKGKLEQTCYDAHRKILSAIHDEDIRRELSGSALSSRPYIRIAAAAGLAFHHEYPTAIAILHEWLERYTLHTKEELTNEQSEMSARLRVSRSSGRRYEHLTASNGTKDPSDHTSKVFELRIRTQIAAYIEEWMRYQPGANGESVLSYHLSNIDKSISLIEKAFGVTVREVMLPEEVLGLEQAFHDETEKCNATNSKADLTDYAPTTPPQDRQKFLTDLRKLNQQPNEFSERDMRMALIYVLFTLKRTWIDAALQSNQYYPELAATAKTYAEEMVRTNLACLFKEVAKSDSGFIATMRAQSLLEFANVELANLQGPLMRLVSKEEKENKARLAAKAVYLGVDKISRFHDEKRQEIMATSEFLPRISTSELFETYNLLVSAQKKLTLSLKG